MLGAALGSHPDELRADFQRFYGLNLDDLGTGYRCMHAAALVAHMPADSALYAALAYDEQNRDPMRGMDERRLEAVARSLGVRR